MREFVRHSGRKCVPAVVLSVLLGALPVFFPGPASAAGYEVRMPVRQGPGVARQEDAAAASPAKGGSAAERAVSPRHRKRPAVRRTRKAAGAKSRTKPRRAQPSAAVPAKAVPAKVVPAKVVPAKVVPAKAASAKAKPAGPKVRKAQPPKAKSPKAKNFGTKAPGTKALGAKPRSAAERKAAPEAAVRVKRVPASRSDRLAAASPRIDPAAKRWPAGPAGEPEAALPKDGRWVGGLGLDYEKDAVVLHAATNAEPGRVTWFNVGASSGPRKLALDLRGAWRKKGVTLLRCASGPVKSVAVGLHEDRLRLAVEFRRGAVDPDLEPQIERGPQGLSVRIPLAVRLVHPGPAAGRKK